MLQIIEDSQLQIKMTEIYKANKHRGFDFLESLLDRLQTKIKILLINLKKSRNVIWWYRRLYVEIKFYNIHN